MNKTDFLFHFFFFFDSWLIPYSRIFHSHNDGQYMMVEGKQIIH